VEFKLKPVIDWPLSTSTARRWECDGVRCCVGPETKDGVETFYAMANDTKSDVTPFEKQDGFSTRASAQRWAWQKAKLLFEAR
jgi:hypothetical protein